ncbi:MAG: hypothetical protein IT176_07115 [Acidobacteria bacterium]|nr:hypothetical protein [Acidobacteriota bacterium]
MVTTRLDAKLLFIALHVVRVPFRALDVAEMHGLQRDSERQPQLRRAEIDVELLLAANRSRVALCRGLNVAQTWREIGCNSRGHVIRESHRILVLLTYRVRSLGARR